MKTKLTRDEQKTKRRECYYRRYMREWCRRHKLPFVAAYKRADIRNATISNITMWRKSLGLPV